MRWRAVCINTTRDAHVTPHPAPRVHGARATQGEADLRRAAGRTGLWVTGAGANVAPTRVRQSTDARRSPQAAGRGRSTIFSSSLSQPGVNARAARHACRLPMRDTHARTPRQWRPFVAPLPLLPLPFPFAPFVRLDAPATAAATGPIRGPTDVPADVAAAVGLPLVRVASTSPGVVSGEDRFPDDVDDDDDDAPPGGTSGRERNSRLAWSDTLVGARPRRRSRGCRSRR